MHCRAVRATILDLLGVSGGPVGNICAFVRVYFWMATGAAVSLAEAGMIAHSVLQFYCRKCCGTEHSFDGKMNYAGGCDKCKDSPVYTVEIEVPNSGVHAAQLVAAKGMLDDGGNYG